MLFRKHDQTPHWLATTLTIGLLVLGGLTPCFADERNDKGFFSTWRLMSNQEKQQFLAGYLRGWKDAQQVTEVAIGYVEQNPKNALEGLKSLRGLYEVASLTPDTLARTIDGFYKNPENADAALSAAVTAARNSH